MSFGPFSPNSPKNSSQYSSPMRDLRYGSSASSPYARHRETNQAYNSPTHSDTSMGVGSPWSAQSARSYDDRTLAMSPYSYELTATRVRTLFTGCFGSRSPQQSPSVASSPRTPNVPGLRSFNPSFASHSMYIAGFEAETLRMNLFPSQSSVAQVAVSPAPLVRVENRGWVLKTPTPNKVETPPKHHYCNRVVQLRTDPVVTPTRFPTRFPTRARLVADELRCSLSGSFSEYGSDNSSGDEYVGLPVRRVLFPGATINDNDGAFNAYPSSSDDECTPIVRESQSLHPTMESKEGSGLPKRDPSEGSITSSQGKKRKLAAGNEEVPLKRARTVSGTSIDDSTQSAVSISGSNVSKGSKRAGNYLDSESPASKRARTESSSPSTPPRSYSPSAQECPPTVARTGDNRDAPFGRQSFTATRRTRTVTTTVTDVEERVEMSSDSQ